MAAKRKQQIKERRRLTKYSKSFFSHGSGAYATQKYHRKGNNSVILKAKYSKRLHDLHTATTNLNP